jgi:hypothetical protein
LIIFNNDSKATKVSFDISMVKAFPPNSTLVDELGKSPTIKLEGGKVGFSMPARTAGIYTLQTSLKKPW